MSEGQIYENKIEMIVVLEDESWGNSLCLNR